MAKVQPLVIVHDYLLQMGGAERVVELMHKLFPEAPVVTSAVDENKLLKGFAGAHILTSWMQQLPGITSKYKWYFPLYPWAFKSFGRLKAQVALISSSGFAKWIRVTPGTKTICYCYTPPRFFWLTDRYLKDETQNPILRKFLKWVLTFFRLWDYRQAQQIDHYVAISNCIQDRIRDCYGRESEVIYPPVDVNRFRVTGIDEGYYLIVSRLVAYKRVDLAIEAFNQNGLPLWIAGGGPDRNRLEAMAGPNVKLLGRLPDEDIQDLFEKSHAIVFPGCEDFGIVPVEANACGKPVVAYAEGGALETLVAGETGVFFEEWTPESMNRAVDTLESTSWDARQIRRNAERFNEEVFSQALRELVEKAQG